MSDLATFRKAVVDGEHPDGDSLDRDMPRWRMSDADLSAILSCPLSFILYYYA